MRKLFFLLLFFLMGSAGLLAQEILPALTVKNLNGKIIVSWRNEYPLVIKTINIQRSFDSLKNYSTIGSVLNPQNRENGYADEKPPYNKMYYRVFISFDGGEYIFSEAVRPVKEIPPPLPILVTTSPTDPGNEHSTDPKIITDPNRISPGTVHILPGDSSKKIPPNPPAAEVITYPSRRIFTGRDNNVVISLPDAGSKKYTVTFFDDTNKRLFQLNKLTDSWLIVEKVNFKHAGWFYFEVHEGGKLIEKNKFYVPRDGKAQSIPVLEQGKGNK